MGKEKKGVGRGEENYLLQYQEPTIYLSVASISFALAHGALEVKPWLRGRWITIKIQIDRQKFRERSHGCVKRRISQFKIGRGVEEHGELHGAMFVRRGGHNQEALTL
jgi:hypothetical protein